MKHTTIEDYLQMDGWEPPPTSTNGKKRVCIVLKRTKCSLLITLCAFLLNNRPHESLIHTQKLSQQT